MISASSGKEPRGSLPSARFRERRLAWCLLILVATLAAFLGVFGNDFVQYDDEKYITANPPILEGLTWRSFVWDFTSVQTANWHPLTWLSHQIDVELFGLDPRGHHFTSLLFHAANAMLLFLALDLMTARTTPSAVAALLFAVHPMHVESVAWAAERKDVLSAFCFMLTLLLYLRYLRRPSAGRMGAAAAVYAAGLAAKPMLVTLPFVLLLLDWWPLARRGTGAASGGEPATKDGRSSCRALLLEKTPLFILSAASSILTYLAQQVGGAVRPTDFYNFPVRLENAVISWAAYLGKLFWPSKMAVFYPHSRAGFPAWKVLLALGVLSAVTAAVLVVRRGKPHAAMGWFWYLGMLVPVIGLVQVGAQSMADRYTYLPYIGLFIGLCWESGSLARRTGRVRLLLPAAAAVWVAVLMSLTWIQVGRWKDNLTLFRHAVAVTRDNWQAHLNLAMGLARRGLPEEARVHYAEAFRIRPEFAQSHSRMNIPLPSMKGREIFFPPRPEGVPREAWEKNGQGLDLLGRDRLQEAGDLFRQAVELAPGWIEAKYNLANTLSRQGLLEQAVARYREILETNPEDGQVHNNLGVTLNRMGRQGEARQEFQEAVRWDPGNPEAHNNFGVTLKEEGRRREAEEQFRQALRVKPGYVTAMVNLGDMLLEDGEDDEASAWFRAALRLDPENERARRALDRATLGGRVNP